jgi:hypothetical protein
MEIRPSVTAYVADRIAACRQQQELETSTEEKVAGGYRNVSVIRANSMKHMPNFFAKGQVGDERRTTASALGRSESWETEMSQSRRSWGQLDRGLSHSCLP